jgi:hypothetical protein
MAHSASAVRVASRRSGSGSEVRQHLGGLLGQLHQALEVGLDDPQAPEHGRRGRDRAAVRLGEAVPERLGEVVPLGPDPLHRREGVGPEDRLVVRHPELARPGQEPVDHLIGLPGRLPARRAELPHRLQHPEPGARGGVGHLEQGLVDQPLQDPQHLLVAEQVPRGVGGEAGGEDRQRPHRRPPGRLQQVPAPVDHPAQGLVALGGVARAAPEQAEAVLQAPGDLGDRHHPDPRRRQLHRQRQPVQVTADLLHHLGGQVDPGAGRPGALPEQLPRGGQRQLRQRVHRLR